MVRKMNAARAESPVEVEASADPHAQQMFAWERPAEADAVAVESPARMLQIELERSWSPERGERRWSPRRSLGFILIANGFLWGALVWGVTKVV